MYGYAGRISDRIGKGGGKINGTLWSSNVDDVGVLAPLAKYDVVYPVETASVPVDVQVTVLMTGVPKVPLLFNGVTVIVDVPRTPLHAAFAERERLMLTLKV